MTKRKREEVEQIAISEPTRHKTNEAKKPTSRIKDEQSVKDVNIVIGKMNSRLLADYVAQCNRRFGEQLSPVELEDTRIPGNIGRHYSYSV